MYARQTSIKADPERIDEAVAAVRRDVLPALESSDGFKGFTLLVDRETGACVGTSYFDSRESLEANEEAVRPAREATARESGSDVMDVRVFEVAIDTQV